jgi:hypothetical protein
MKPPVIVLCLDEGGTPLFFRSSRDAESYLEPVDVNAGEYLAYDSEGRQLVIKAFETKGFWSTGGYVVIEEAEEEPQHVAELREALLTFLRRHAPPSEWTNAALEDLIEKAIEISGWQR